MRDDQFTLIHIGTLIAHDDPSFKIGRFADLEELRIYLNRKYTINIKEGMLFVDVVKELENGIKTTAYNNAMAAI